VFGAAVAWLAVRFIPFMQPSPSRHLKSRDMENEPPAA
jgi:hypothetical protein